MLEFLCLIVVLGVIGFCLIKDNHLFKPPVHSNQISYSLNGQFELNPLITEHSGLGTLSSPDSNTTTKKFAESLLDELNPTNDWMVTFEAKDEGNLSSRLMSAGIEIIDQIPELSVLRFSIVDPVRALPIINELFNQQKVSVNVPLRNPFPPREDLILESSGFSDSFIKWMGGSTQRTDFGKGVKVAVIDSGVDSYHPSLRGVIIRQKDLLKEFTPSTKAQGHAHGTAVASIISSPIKEYNGIAPGSEILSYRVIDESGSTDSYKVASAIVSAVKDGADVINLSLGGEEGNRVLENAVSFAIDNNVPIVAAVGNDGVGLVNYPAAYKGVLGVTSVGLNGRVSNFANYGDGVDFAAPGTDILTASEGSEMGYFSGTSVSAAMVTGAIAMELSRHPELTISGIRELLEKFSNEAELPGFDNFSGHGILSLSRLEQRGNTDFSDPALVGYYFDHPVGQGAGTIPFQVIVQNQGNTWIGETVLHVNYLGMDKAYLINNLEPGETRSERLYLQAHEIIEPLKINARISLPVGVPDDRLENNERNSVIQF